MILGAATPFLMDELIFTWPKLLAASMVLLAALAIVERRAFLSGLFVGIGYLMHPSALLALAGIGLLALWPLRGANWKRPDLKARSCSASAWRSASSPGGSSTAAITTRTASSNTSARPGRKPIPPSAPGSTTGSARSATRRCR